MKTGGISTFRLMLFRWLIPPKILLIQYQSSQEKKSIYKIFVYPKIKLAMKMMLRTIKVALSFFHCPVQSLRMT